MIELKSGMRVHFVGIGGVAMSALAELLHRQGARVTGTDRQRSGLTERLAGMGIRVDVGHFAGAVGAAGLVVYTPAVAPDNPELAEAARRGIPTVKRADLLEHLCRGRRVVGVAGTHGKTTTTAMVGAILEAAGLDPTVFVGGVIRGPEGNLRVGEGAVWAVEADEFDRSFLKLTPAVAVVTSLDADHLDCYGDIGAICEAFEAFLDRVPQGGQAVLCFDAPRVRGLRVRPDVGQISYGIGPGARLFAGDVVREGFGSRFRVLDGGRPVGDLRLRVPGMHNVANALAAVGAADALGLPWGPIARGLEAFEGVRRRFEVLGEAGGVTVVSDYAHHPAEIQATLATARAGWPGRIVGVFQPHLYSRTRDLAEEFGKALCAADRVWLADVYAARERPMPGVDGGLIAACVRAAGGPEPSYVPALSDLVPALVSELRRGDLLVVMGAGDVERVAYEAYERLQGRCPTATGTTCSPGSSGRAAGES